MIVGHNIRFDCGFLDAALVDHGYPPLANRRVDTIGMARRLVRDDVPNLRLHTLAAHFRTETEPVHRAYADAAATAELFHRMLEHAATWGVLGLDDLVALPKIRVHSSTAKLALTARMPRVPGVYVFRDRRGEVLFVGKATNLRARCAPTSRARTGGRCRSCCARRRASSTGSARARSRRPCASCD